MMSISNTLRVSKSIVNSTELLLNSDFLIDMRKYEHEFIIRFPFRVSLARFCDGVLFVFGSVSVAQQLYDSSVFLSL